MNADREKLRKRIRSLLDKTATRGCTEAEAMAAAEKAAALMREHGIGRADVQFEREHIESRTKGGGERDGLWPAIATCTNTAVIVLDHFGHPSRVEFIGREPGPQIAVYLFQVTDRAIGRAVREFKAGQYYRRRRALRIKREAMADFTAAMVNRLARRLLAMFEPSLSASALVEAKKARDGLYPNNRTVHRPDRQERHWEAGRAGSRAGEAVNLAHGVSAGKAPLRIGAAE